MSYGPPMEPRNSKSRTCWAHWALRSNFYCMGVNVNEECKERSRYMTFSAIQSSRMRLNQASPFQWTSNSFPNETPRIYCQCRLTQQAVGGHSKERYSQAPRKISCSGIHGINGDSVVHNSNSVGQKVHYLLRSNRRGEILLVP